MANTETRRPEFAYVRRLTKHGTKYVACGGVYRHLLVAQRASGGGVTWLGESDELLSEPLDVVSNGTPSAYYALTALGITTLSAANAPAITAEATFKTGGHPWLCFTASSRLLAPLESGGVRLLSTAGATLAELCNIVSESTAGVLDGTVLYLFDAQRARLHFITVGASSLTYEGSVAAPNCRDIVRAVVDGNNLYCVCRHRVVRFDVTDALEPAFADDFGVSTDTFTDAVVLASDKIWVGEGEYGVWNSSNSELNAVHVASSAWRVQTDIPYIDDEGAAGTLLPAAPAISSSLTSNATEDDAWTYTITATGVGPVQFSSANLPAWATLNSITGIITGTPPEAATVNISITATNSGGSDTETLVLTVASSGVAPAIDSITVTPDPVPYSYGDVDFEAAVTYDGLNGALVYNWYFTGGPATFIPVSDDTNPAVFTADSSTIPGTYYFTLEVYPTDRPDLLATENGTIEVVP